MRKYQEREKQQGMEFVHMPKAWYMKCHCEVPKPHWRVLLGSWLVREDTYVLNSLAVLKVLSAIQNHLSTTFPSHAFRRQGDEVLYFVKLKERHEITKRSCFGYCTLTFLDCWEVLPLGWFTYLYPWNFIYHTENATFLTTEYMLMFLVRDHFIEKTLVRMPKLILSYTEITQIPKLQTQFWKMLC